MWGTVAKSPGGRGQADDIIPGTSLCPSSPWRPVGFRFSLASRSRPNAVPWRGDQCDLVVFGRGVHAGDYQAQGRGECTTGP